MSIHNLDEDKTLHDSLEFVIDGKKFTVKKLTNKILNKMDEVELLSEQLAVLCSVDPKETIDLDLRKVGTAIRIILKSVAESMGGEQFLKHTKKKSKKTPRKTTVKNR